MSGSSRRWREEGGGEGFREALHGSQVKPGASVTAPLESVSASVCVCVCLS